MPRRGIETDTHLTLVSLERQGGCPWNPAASDSTDGRVPWLRHPSAVDAVDSNSTLGHHGKASSLGIAPAASASRPLNLARSGARMSIASRFPLHGFIKVASLREGRRENVEKRRILPACQRGHAFCANSTALAPSRNLASGQVAKIQASDHWGSVSAARGSRARSRARSPRWLCRIPEDVPKCPHAKRT